MTLTWQPATGNSEASTSGTEMYKKTESLAWAVLMLSFCTCVALCRGCAVRHAALRAHAMRPMMVVLQRREGIVTQRASGSSATIVVDTQAG